MKRFIPLLFACMVPATFAIMPWEPHFTWILPTEYTSGAPLDPADILEAQLFCNGATTPDFVIPSPDTDFTTPFKYFRAGAHACHMIVVLLPGIGDNSGPSNTVNFTVPEDAVKAAVLSVD